MNDSRALARSVSLKAVVCVSERINCTDRSGEFGYPSSGGTRLSRTGCARRPKVSLEVSHGVPWCPMRAVESQLRVVGRGTRRRRLAAAAPASSHRRPVVGGSLCSSSRRTRRTGEVGAVVGAERVPGTALDVRVLKRHVLFELQDEAATWVSGFVNNFLKVPLACWAAEKLQNNCGTLR